MALISKSEHNEFINLPPFKRFGKSSCIGIEDTYGHWQFNLKQIQLNDDCKEMFDFSYVNDSQNKQWVHIDFAIGYDDLYATIGDGVPVPGKFLSFKPYSL
jgi:hypothetical protein